MGYGKGALVRAMSRPNRKMAWHVGVGGPAVTPELLEI